MASDVIKDQERGGEDLLEYSALRNQGFSHLPQCALLIFHIAELRTSFWISYLRRRSCVIQLLYFVPWSFPSKSQFPSQHKFVWTVWSFVPSRSELVTTFLICLNEKEANWPQILIVSTFVDRNDHRSKQPSIELTCIHIVILTLTNLKLVT